MEYNKETAVKSKKNLIHIITNPAANRGRAISFHRRFRFLLRKQGIKSKEYITEYPGNAEEIARRITSEGIDNLFVIGGDGTYNEVINGCSRFNVNLALIPAGSCNDFSLEIGHWAGFKSLLKNYFEGNIIKTDTGRVNGRLFLNNMGSGFDAEIINDMIKHNLKTNSSYVLMTLKNLFQFEPFEADITTEKQKCKAKLLMLTVNNASTYGGGFRIAPGAEIDDGKLDICLIKSINKLRFLKNFPLVYTGEHLKISEVSYWKTEKLKIKFNRKISLQLDGELLRKKYKILKVDLLSKAFNIYRY